MDKEQQEVLQLFEQKADAEEWYTIEQVSQKTELARSRAIHALVALWMIGALEWEWSDQGMVYNLASGE